MKEATVAPPCPEAAPPAEALKGPESVAAAPGGVKQEAAEAEGAPKGPSEAAQ